MRKKNKTCIYIITAILPIVLSACSNKSNNNDVPKSVKESTPTSTDITSSLVDTTTEKDTTELISETKQAVLNNTDNNASQQQTQASVQQMTTVTSVATTPVPTTTPAPTTTPVPTTTPILEETTTPRSTATPVQVTPPHYNPNSTKTPTLTVKGIGEKHSYNGIEFTIDSVKDSYDSIADDGYCAICIDITISLTEPRSPYCIYNIYNSDGECIITDTIEFYYHSEISPADPADHTKHLTGYKYIHTHRIPIDNYTIEFTNCQ